MPGRQEQGESQVGGRNPRTLPPGDDELDQLDQPTDADQGRDVEQNQRQGAPQNPPADVADEDDADDEVADDEEDDEEDAEANEEDGSGGHV